MSCRSSAIRSACLARIARAHGPSTRPLAARVLNAKPATLFSRTADPQGLCGFSTSAEESEVDRVLRESAEARKARLGTHLDVEVLRKRCLYNARERGMKENDVVLGRFAEKYLSNLTEEEVYQFDAILQELDPDLWEWITGRTAWPPEHENALKDKIMKFSENVAKDLVRPM